MSVLRIPDDVGPTGKTVWFSDTRDGVLLRQRNRGEGYTMDEVRLDDADAQELLALLAKHYGKRLR